MFLLVAAEGDVAPRDVLAGAAEGRTRALFPPKADAEAGKKASTVAEKFRGQLTKLMTTVERTRPFFIRCI